MEIRMKVNYYEEDDILVVKLSDNPITYAEESNLVVIHFDEDDTPTRIEILDAQRFFELEGFALPSNLRKKYFSPA